MYETSLLSETYLLHKQLLELNKTTPIIKQLDDRSSECAELLHQIVGLLLKENYNAVRDLLYDGEVFLNNFRALTDKERNAVTPFIDYEEMRYSDLVGLAFDSFCHANYVLFYGTLRLLLSKLDLLSRLFYDEKSSLRDIENRLARILGLGPLTQDEVQPDFQWYYKECTDNFFPDVGCNFDVNLDWDEYHIAINNRVKSFALPHCNIEQNFTDQRFNQCIEEERFGKFILDAEAYILSNKGLPPTSVPSYMWYYLAKGYLFDFAKGRDAWNVDFSKTLLKAIIGYSKSIEDAKPLEYTDKIKMFIGEMIQLILSLADIMPKHVARFREDSNLEHKTITQMSVFLTNLFFLFPVFDLSGIIDTKLYLFQHVDFHVYGYILSQIEELDARGRIESKKCRNLEAGATYTPPVVIEPYVSAQYEKPSFSHIGVYVNMPEFSTLSWELYFYDEKGQELILGNAPGDRLVLDVENSYEGGKAFELTILGCSDIKTVVAKSFKGLASRRERVLL